MRCAPWLRTSQRPCIIGRVEGAGQAEGACARRLCPDMAARGLSPASPRECQFDCGCRATSPSPGLCRSLWAEAEQAAVGATAGVGALILCPSCAGYASVCAAEGQTIKAPTPNGNGTDDGNASRPPLLSFLGLRRDKPRRRAVSSPLRGVSHLRRTGHKQTPLRRTRRHGATPILHPGRSGAADGGRTSPPRREIMPELHIPEVRQ